MYSHRLINTVNTRRQK